MTKTLIIMRHGKAQAAAEGQDDFDRKLSEAGKRALSASLPHSLALLDRSSKNVRIASSSAVRAMQTAALLEKALKAAGVKAAQGVEECAELWYQDVDGFLDYVACCDCETLFAVGHNPFVEDLAERLTGAKIPCATGALVCIALDMQSNCASSAQGSYANRLMWFSQGPMSQNWKTLVNIESILADSADSMLQKRDAFFSDPDDIETLHKLRVSIRTLRSLTAFVKPWQNRAQNAELQAILKDIVAHTSRLRELDVFACQARESEDASEELVAFCEHEALAERQRVLDALASKRCAKSFKKAASLARSIKWNREVVNDGLPAKAVRDHFDDVAEHLGDDIRNLALSDVERTHDVRKSAKRVRYAAEGFKQILGDDSIDIAKGMTAHQDNLGAICDARINIDLINEYLGRELPERVSWDLKLLRAQNETFLYNALKAND